ncbi:MAG: Transketolase central region [Solirubrobacterales bacterium]|jgi:2-oxoisovalerate dehydrogenase E1 component|nr:Transketolase central region [Solirubrobacterales bacterium]
MTREYRYLDGIRDALTHQMATDDRVLTIGIDVGRPDGPYTVTKGLYAAFGGERVLDTPIAEMGFVGAAVGAAMAGARPMVELMYLDFIGSCLEPLLNQASKISYMSNGALSVPLVVRTQMGTGGSAAAQHSQNLEAMLAHIPGLKVVVPATPTDAYGLLTSAFADPGPVIYIENRSLYRFRSGERPDDGYAVPLGQARTVTSGDDVTLISYSRALHDCMTAVPQLQEDGIAVDLIDLRSIVPLDFEAVAESVRRTHRAVIVHDAVETFGVGAELTARISTELFDWLDAPVERVAAGYAPSPFAPSLERANLPNPERVRNAVRAACGLAAVEPAAA